MWIVTLKLGLTVFCLHNNRFSYLSVTNILILSNIVIFLALFSISHYGSSIDSNLLIKYGAINSYQIEVFGEWWRLLSSVFLHLDFTHLFMNMLSLYIIGSIVQKLYSASMYLFFYLSTAIFGSLLSLAESQYDLLVGASGAIFGLFGVLVGYFVVNREIPSVSKENAITNFWFIVGLNIVIGLSVSNIAILAHFGGIISGFLAGYLVEKYQKKGFLAYIGIFVIAFIYYYFAIMKALF